MPTSVITANIDRICESEVAALRCRSCSGLADCKQSSLGIFPTVDVYLGRLGFGVAFCDFKKLEMENQKIKSMFKLSGVPPKYANKKFCDFIETRENEKALRAAQWAVKNEGKGVLLFGPPGTGKTLLASIMCSEILSQGKVAMFVSLPDLLAEIKRSYDTGNTADVLRAVNEVPFIVMDDMGAERVTAWVGEQLFSILNSRLNHGKQTIITTNHMPRELAARLQSVDAKGCVIDDMQGRRIVSRLAEMCYFVEIGGDDWRTTERG